MLQSTFLRATTIPDLWFQLVREAVFERTGNIGSTAREARPLGGGSWIFVSAQITHPGTRPFGTGTSRPTWAFPIPWDPRIRRTVPALLHDRQSASRGEHYTYGPGHGPGRSNGSSTITRKNGPGTKHCYMTIGPSPKSLYYYDGHRRL